jgi:hypothetical protein
MIRLIVTANDELYERLSEIARAEGEAPQRARTVLQAFRRATVLGTQANNDPDPRADGHLARIVVDMALVAADTLIEALHSRPYTSQIPLLAVRCNDRRLPLSLRRLCVEILSPDSNLSGDGGSLAEGERPSDEALPLPEERLGGDL